jgi:glycosyltransferase involved in cell wall biosynthesis
VFGPVYNSGKYLAPCLESILAQTLKEIEVVCVDDGSTDGSPALLDEYAARGADR